MERTDRLTAIEHRLDAVETLAHGNHRSLDTQFKRMATLQADLDLVLAAMKRCP